MDREVKVQLCESWTPRELRSRHVERGAYNAGVLGGIAMFFRAVSIGSASVNGTTARCGSPCARLRRVRVRELQAQ